MSAPITKSQMAFELPKLSYIDTSLEEPAILAPARPVDGPGLAHWIATGLASWRAWRQTSRARAELLGLTDRELLDVGLNRGDFDRVFDNRLNRDLNARGHAF